MDTHVRSTIYYKIRPTRKTRYLVLDLIKSFKQGRSKVFITGQARVNPEHYVIKCVCGGR